MLIETVEKTLKSQISKENKRNFLFQEVPNFIDELFLNKNTNDIEKLFLLIHSLPKDINKSSDLEILFSTNLFRQSDVEFFNAVMKNKKLLLYFADNQEVLAHGLYQGDIRNVFAFYKRLKIPIFFSESKIYEYQHKFPSERVMKFYSDLYKILEYSNSEEPLYLPYHIIHYAIKQKNVLMLESGFKLISNNNQLQKIFMPILWSIYANSKLDDLIFLETNQDILKDLKVCNADYLCEFLPDYIFQNVEELKFFNYILSHSQEHNKETVMMVLNHLKNLNLHAKNFYFIFSFHHFLKSTNNGRLYILEDILRNNGVLELIEIIKD